MSDILKKYSDLFQLKTEQLKSLNNSWKQFLFQIKFLDIVRGRHEFI